MKELDAFSPENKFEKAGYEAEKNVAFYLRRFYEDDPTINVLNGIRIVKDNDAAQIDHLIIHKSGMIVIECKSVHDKIKIEEDGQWACWFDGQTKGMASPIKQAEMQADFLRKYLNKNSTKDPQKFDRMPIKILVAISNEGQFFRPKNNPKAAPEVCKMDQLKERIDEIRNDNTKQFLTDEGISLLSKNLIKDHKPRSSTSNPLRVAEPAKEYSLNTKTPKKKIKPFCASCKTSVSDTVANFCWSDKNKSRFNNKVYCIDCQKNIPIP